MTKVVNFLNLNSFKSKSGKYVYIFDYVTYNNKLHKYVVISNFIDDKLYDKLVDIDLIVFQEVEISLEIDEFMQLKLVDVNIN